ncbi:DUF1328 domain-containing protein [Xanthomonas campestris pv. passiflorae]|uniref:DUF1328 domain-containing protein n=1 Tax=Xanthomonas campestris TaxID=339 RepID=UPI00242205C1|nr:DUF1328 domain-containing protein [Xanthomonas campestris]MBV6814737.1 DUF1328 domain-containing protein [Xanthomonas campestris pv. passiflorae]
MDKVASGAAAGFARMAGAAMGIAKFLFWAGIIIAIVLFVLFVLGMSSRPSTAWLGGAHRRAAFAHSADVHLRCDEQSGDSKLSASFEQSPHRDHAVCMPAVRVVQAC